MKASKKNLKIIIQQQDYRTIFRMVDMVRGL